MTRRSTKPSAGRCARSLTYWLHQAFTALNVAIGGGTSNIQRNIIGEKVLGLPRDPRPARSGKQ